jgi:hypothetical protein
MLAMLLLAGSLLDGTLSLLGREGMGSACPISETQALTAEHVTSVALPTGTHRVMPLIWSDSLGNTGWGREVLADLTRDLSLFESMEGKFKKWFSLSQTEPKPGDEIYILGYDFAKGAIRKEFKAKVLNSDGAHLVYSRGGEPGSSGSCVLNEKGEVVAINTGYFVLEMGDVRGRGLNVWGPWSKFKVPEGIDVGEESTEAEAVRRP